MNLWEMSVWCSCNKSNNLKRRTLKATCMILFLPRSVKNKFNRMISPVSWNAWSRRITRLCASRIFWTKRWLIWWRIRISCFMSTQRPHTRKGIWSRRHRPRIICSRGMISGTRMLSPVTPRWSESIRSSKGRCCPQLIPLCNRRKYVGTFRISSRRRCPRSNSSSISCRRRWQQLHRRYDRRDPAVRGNHRKLWKRRNSPAVRVLPNGSQTGALAASSRSNG